RSMSAANAPPRRATIARASWRSSSSRPSALAAAASASCRSVKNGFTVPAASAALEPGLALVRERLVGLAEIARLHADLLGLRLRLDGIVEVLGQLAAKRLLGH